MQPPYGVSHRLLKLSLMTAAVVPLSGHEGFVGCVNNGNEQNLASLIFCVKLLDTI